MVMMEGRYSEDHLRQLWHRIDTLHLSYLETEESPEKLETRNKLENCIRDFLCVASPEQKFYNPETMEVLYRSAASKPDFSGYKACTGFNTLQLYAGNILSQPWRKEYHQIKLFSGFYKHHIEANLAGAEILFKAMGYTYVNDGILMLEGPVCPDKATAVSRDCLVAYVECQIIKTIWEELTPLFDISWLDVLEYRKKYNCSAEKTTKIIKYQFNQKKYQDSIKNGYTDVDRDYLQNAHQKNVVPTQSYYPTNYNNQPYSDMNSAYSRYPYEVEVCPNLVNLPMPSANYTHTMPTPIPRQVLPDQYGRYCCSDPYTPKQCPLHDYSTSYNVPTAELIKFNTPNGTYNSPPNYNQVKLPRDSQLTELNRPTDTYLRKMSEDATDSADNAEKKSHFEDWDYVYRDLENQGYSKDLGERGNILNGSEAAKQNLYSNSVRHNSFVGQSEVDAGPNVKHIDKTTRISKPKASAQSESIYYNNINKPVQSKVSSNSKSKNASLTKKNIVDDVPPTKLPQNQYDLVDGRAKQSNIINHQRKQTGQGKWECKTCTFLNNNLQEVCEMCSKSKSVVIQPIEIGGTECSKCTLVNPKDLNYCSACDSSLKDSPTYI